MERLLTLDEVAERSESRLRRCGTGVTGAPVLRVSRWGLVGSCTGSATSFSGSMVNMLGARCP